MASGEARLKTPPSTRCCRGHLLASLLKKRFSRACRTNSHLLLLIHAPTRRLPARQGGGRQAGVEFSESCVARLDCRYILEVGRIESPDQYFTARHYRSKDHERLPDVSVAEQDDDAGGGGGGGVANEAAAPSGSSKPGFFTFIRDGSELDFAATAGERLDLVIGHTGSCNGAKTCLDCVVDITVRTLAQALPPRTCLFCLSLCLKTFFFFPVSVSVLILKSAGFFFSSLFFCVLFACVFLTFLFLVCWLSLAHCTGRGRQKRGQRNAIVVSDWRTEEKPRVGLLPHC